MTPTRSCLVPFVMAGTLCIAAFPSVAAAQNTPCILASATTLTCTGDQSAGVSSGSPIATLNVHTLTADIHPTGGWSISLDNAAGAAIDLSSGLFAVMTTVGAGGLRASSQGAAGPGGRDATALPDFLGGHGADPGGAGAAGGTVWVDAAGRIITANNDAVGIVAQSVGGTGGRGGAAAGTRTSREGGGGGAGGGAVVTGGATIETGGNRASGIIALSHGGDGGVGGSGSFAATADDGGAGGLGGFVNVDGSWTIATDGDNAHGIWAKSVGGLAGGGGSGGWTGTASGSGGAGSAGGTVVVNSRGAITTHGNDSIGIHAASVGGFGGSGGSGGIIFFSSGGSGASAGSGGTVSVTNTGAITTSGDRAHAIYAQSVGGGGGSGAGGGGAIVSLGGSGSSGGDGGFVLATNRGSIQTSGIGARGIYAQSIGGGGGDSGGAGGLVAIGGDGNATGAAGFVLVTNSGAITTSGSAIFAQSIGGGGGSAGTSGGWVSIGGSGASGGNGGTVIVRNRGNLSTSDAAASAIFAQSLGGGGGNGGRSGSGGLFATASIGGSGAGGGTGGAVIVGDETASGAIGIATGRIQTTGESAHGIHAQSVGGGGGTGGFAVGVAAGIGASAAFSMGGSGGGANRGGAVTVYFGDANSRIETSGQNASALFAQSIGGGGGAGQFSVSAAGSDRFAAAVALGGSGGAGGDGGAVTALNAGATIATTGHQSHGLLAQSVGGGGGHGAFSIAGAVSAQAATGVSLGGRGGNAGRGGALDVLNNGRISTAGELSHGLFAQSLGGGGGSGGFSFAGAFAIPVNSTSGAVAFTMGGSGGAGNDASTVLLNNQAGGIIETSRRGSYGILAASQGGGGGVGGFSGTLAGLGENANVSVALGGAGGAGSNADRVAVNNAGRITTHADNSYGIFAQSLGGGGGDAGFGLAASIGGAPLNPGSTTRSVNLAVALGGSGGGGGYAGAVDLSNSALIRTSGEHSDGIHAYSLGGGGGNGGWSASGTLRLAFEPGSSTQSSPQIAVGVGGAGGAGNYGGRVTVANSGGIATESDDSSGIVAKSTGGGGGNGGFSFAGSFSTSEATAGASSLPANIGVAVGSAGGDGSFGGAVSVRHCIAGTDGACSAVSAAGQPAITAQGSASHGIWAQSVGGGGGNGGVAISTEFGLGGAEQTVNLSQSVSVGGSGGAGNVGGTVDVDARGAIRTEGERSHGIIAQSIGGGGGNGGFAFAANIGADLVNEEERRTGKTISGNVAVGGEGGSGNQGGRVAISNLGAIDTSGSASNGIFAQSIGGGGGQGGSASSLNFQFHRGDFTSQTATVRNFFSREGVFDNWKIDIVVGGAGGSANHGGDVAVVNQGAITTRGAMARGIWAQSIGGGGGSGGAAESGIAGILVEAGVDEETAQTIARSADFAQFVAECGPCKLANLVAPTDLNASVGGNAGSSGNAATVSISNSGNITTYGDQGHAIFAQSIGGGGGAAAHFLQPVGGQFEQEGVARGGKASTGFNGKVAIGGAGGAGGHGGAVIVTNTAQNVHTFGSEAHGIFAQSIGGGGGVAGGVERCNPADSGAGIPGLSNLSCEQGNNFGVYFGMGRDGGGAGNGGAVTVVNTGNITTNDDHARGIFAQSVGGGGGAAGGRPSGIPTVPFNFAGSVGGFGSGNEVTVSHIVGRIATSGDRADGIFAQSAGGAEGTATDGQGVAVAYAGAGGRVSVTVGGTIAATGGDSNGVYAQSVGLSRSGDIAVTIETGAAVTGGTGAGAGIRIADGASNVVTNRGAVGTSAGLAGRAVVGGAGSETVNNFGTMTGSIELGAGTNALNNQSGAVLNAGAALALGDGNTFTNAGTFSAGGAGVVQTTVLTGDLVQTDTPTWLVDIGDPGLSDRLTVSGSALLGASTTTVDIREMTTPTTTGEYTLLSAGGGLLGARFRFGSLTGAMPNGMTFELANSETSERLTLGASTGEFHWNGSTSSVWNSPFAGGRSNWTRHESGAEFVFGTPGAASDVIFSSSGPAGANTTLGEDFTINSLTFARSGGAGAGGHAAVGGNSTLTLAATGGRGVTIDHAAPDAGIAADVALGASQTWTNDGAGRFTVSGASIIGAGHDLTIDGSGTTIIDAAIRTGQGSLTKTGAGSLVLGGANTYAGGTTILGGRLLGDAGSLQGNMRNDAEIAFTQGSNGRYGASISGSGSLTKQGGGVLVLTGNNAYTGGTTILEGTLQGDTNSLQGNIRNDSEVVFDQGWTGRYTGSITGTGSLVKEGGGVLFVGGTNSYTGGTTVYGGTLVGNAQALQGHIRNYGAVVFDQAGRDRYAGNMSGSGSLAKYGSGLLILGGANSYTGGTTVYDGTLQGNARSLQGDIRNHAEVVFDQAGMGTYAGNMTGTGFLRKSGPGLLILAGTNSYSGGTLVGEGTLQGDTRSLQGDIHNDAVVVFDQAATGTYTAAMTGTGVFVKRGGGALHLSGHSGLFLGSTEIASGDLVVDGWLGGKSLLVQAGTLLGGSGVVPSTTIQSGATLAPGSSIGVMSVNGDVRFDAGSIYRVETEAYGPSDATFSFGPLALSGGTVDVWAGGTKRYRPIDRYVIFGAAQGVSGTFSGAASSLPYLTPSLAYDASSVYLTLRRNDVDFRAMGSTGHGTAVASTLNELVGEATGAVADVVNTVYDLSDGRAPDAMRSMAGTLYQHVAHSTVTTAQMFMRVNMARLDVVGSGDRRLVADTGLALGGVAPARPAASFATADHLRSDANRGWWLSGLGGITTYSGDAGVSGARAPTTGVVFGFDAAVGEHVLLGVSGGLAAPRVELNDASDYSTARTTQLGIYGRVRGGRSHLDAGFGVGTQDYRTHRAVTDGIDTALAGASYGGTSLSYQLEYGYTVGAARGLDVVPTAGFQRSGAALDGSTETGAPVLGLVLPDRRFASQRSIAGARIRRAFGGGQGTDVAIGGHAAWAHEFTLRTDMPLRFVGDTWTNGFVIAPPRLLRNSALLGAGIAGTMRARVRLFAEVDAEVGGPLTSWRGNLGVQRSW